MGIFGFRPSSKKLIQACKKIIKHPQTVQYLGAEVGATINENFYSLIDHNQGIEIMEKDWDTLVIVDACRYDVYDSIINEQIKCVHSPASTSPVYIKQQYVGNQHHDTVYVTSNPYVGILEEDTFHATIEVSNADQWGEVHPTTLRRKANEVHNEFPEKRIIIHFMQPHRPFLSEFGKNVESKINDWGSHYRPGPAIQTGDIERAYRENLELVINEVQKLNEEIVGKLVVTSDHGELMGERIRPIPVKLFGHGNNLPFDSLRKVPWHTLSYKRRRDISEDRPVAFHVSENTEDRLAAFGYK